MPEGERCTREEQTRETNHLETHQAIRIALDAALMEMIVAKPSLLI